MDAAAKVGRGLVRANLPEVLLQGVEDRFDFTLPAVPGNPAKHLPDVLLGVKVLLPAHGHCHPGATLFSCSACRGQRNPVQGSRSPASMVFSGAMRALDHSLPL
jgi:hypothetical protein